MCVLVTPCYICDVGYSMLQVSLWLAHVTGLTLVTLCYIVEKKRVILFIPYYKCDVGYSMLQVLTGRVWC